ncbi:OmpA family protein [Cognatiyoonia koreensis]|uniref:OmpA family protein n=1 Tax=Cognatiyoonia koreensis TaxID=364200 RepID=A0A1I0RFB8_9RHOB|nr:OmpA family protein [Cognatiyoonia koreensis]SEW39460.1 OmpA family protein [Cognatiyoonia koreensis]
MIRAALLLFLANAASAEALRFPGNAEMSAEIIVSDAQYALPTGPWDGSIPTLPVEGEMVQQAWRINAVGLTSLQLLRPLREQLLNDGFEIIFECETDSCGGFDFRFETLALPAPALQINLADFRFLSAWKADDTGSEVGISLLASQTGTAGYVQVIQIGGNTAAAATATGAPARADASSASRSVDAALETEGYAILDGLTFATGSAQLNEGENAALAALADFLSDNPDVQVALVGHTDAEGSLEGNIALSKRRAGSVLERLVSDYGVPRRQLDAQGMGYLSPVGNNLTQEGRDANRRVEVIVTSTGD